METNGYSIQGLVADLRRVVSDLADETKILSQIRPLAQRAALSKDLWLEKRFYEHNPPSPTAREPTHVRPHRPPPSGTPRQA